MLKRQSLPVGVGTPAKNINSHARTLFADISYWLRDGPHEIRKLLAIKRAHKRRMTDNSLFTALFDHTRQAGKRRFQPTAGAGKLRDHRVHGVELRIKAG